MVNDLHYPKISTDSSSKINAEILDALSRKGGAVSGGELSKRLGISRTAVWKHMHSLIGLGYQIEAGPRGYTLRSPADHLYPWEFAGLDTRILYYSSIGSTMDAADRAAGKGAGHGTVILAEAQAKGRGRYNRSWSSEKGGLYATIILRPDLPLSHCNLINFAAAGSVCEVLDRYYGIRAQVKWPNDIVVDGKKLAGILIEAAGSPYQIDYINLGIGININNSITPSLAHGPSALEHTSLPATSLQELFHTPVLRKELFTRFFENLEYHIQEPGEDILSLWKKHSATLHRRVRIKTNRETIEGTAIDVGRDGGLTVRLDSGTLRNAYTGDLDIVGNAS